MELKAFLSLPLEVALEGIPGHQRDHQEIGKLPFPRGCPYE